MSDALYVSEVFPSTQGEGFFMGTKMVFVRFCGCHLQCGFCDTKYAWDKEGSTLYETISGVIRLADIVFGQLASVGADHVCLTGGEPTDQISWMMGELVVALKSGFPGELTVQVETNGTGRSYWLKEVDWVTVSPKKADSKAYIRDYRWAQEIKVVLAPGEEIPKFLGDLPKERKLMPLTRQPYVENIEYNMSSYSWAVKKAFESGGVWKPTVRLQEFAQIK